MWTEPIYCSLSDKSFLFYYGPSISNPHMWEWHLHFEQQGTGSHRRGGNLLECGYQC